jgi:hypothetical protein
MTRRSLSVPLRMKSPNCAGEIGLTVPPALRSRVLTVVSAMPSFTAGVSTAIDAASTGCRQCARLAIKGGARLQRSYALPASRRIDAGVRFHGSVIDASKIDNSLAIERNRTAPQRAPPPNRCAA